MLMTKTFALVFVMIGLPQAASAVTSIKACPYEIGSPGQYRLDVDCSVPPGGTGIYISASGVHLNLRGHTISGPGCSGPSTFGILVSGSDVHIINGTAKTLTGGLQVQGSPGVPAAHNHLSNLTLRESCTGLVLRDANDNHVNGSNISANAGEGVRLLDANHNVIDSNVINDNDPLGGGVAGGGLLLENSDDNTITSNEFSRNGNFGVRSFGSNHNTIRGNTIKESRGAGIVASDNNNTIQSNRVTGNSPGIQLDLVASGNFVYRNRALQNLGFDLTDTDCNNNIWTNNIFETDNEGNGPGAGCIQ